jgi:hypothetical protein
MCARAAHVQMRMMMWRASAGNRRPTQHKRNPPTQHRQAAPANARRAPRAATALRVRAVLTRPSANGTSNGHAANGHATTATTLHTANGHAPQQQHHQQQQPLVGLPGNTHAKIMDCVRYVRARCALEPEVVVVLGSGLGALADDVTDAVSIPYADIPHFHAPGVVGHQGRLVLGYMRGVPALVLQGRFHYYEGHPMVRAFVFLIGKAVFCFACAFASSDCVMCVFHGRRGYHQTLTTTTKP